MKWHKYLTAVTMLCMQEDSGNKGVPYSPNCKASASSANCVSVEGTNGNQSSDDELVLEPYPTIQDSHEPRETCFEIGNADSSVRGLNEERLIVRRHSICSEKYKCCHLISLYIISACIIAAFILVIIKIIHH